MKKVLFGALLAAVVTFLWGFIFWGTPVGGWVMQELDAASATAVQDAIEQNIWESGVYFVPTEPDGSQHLAGPLAQLFIHKDGAPMMSAWNMIMGFVVMFVAALIFGMFVKGVPAARGSMGATVRFGFMIGLVSAVWSNLGNPFWFYHPWDYSIGVAIYDLVAFTLAGVVFGFYFKGE